MIEHMDDILASGIDSLKIEGRMKTALYVATVARTYRKAIDDYLEDPYEYFQDYPGFSYRHSLDDIFHDYEDPHI